jgi:hypothetical protein
MTYIPQKIIVIDLYGSGYAVLIDAKREHEKVWFSHSGLTACVRNRHRVNGIIEKTRMKNPNIEIIEHYHDGHNEYMPLTEESRRIL